MGPTNQGEADQEVGKLSQVIQIDEGKIQAHLGEVVRSTVEETLNAMLDAEADRLCSAERNHAIAISWNQDLSAGRIRAMPDKGCISVQLPAVSKPCGLVPVLE
jgi:putative transposase